MLRLRRDRGWTVVQVATVVAMREGSGARRVVIDMIPFLFLQVEEEEEEECRRWGWCTVYWRRQVEAARCATDGKQQ